MQAFQTCEYIYEGFECAAGKGLSGDMVEVALSMLHAGFDVRREPFLYSLLVAARAALLKVRSHCSLNRLKSLFLFPVQPARGCSCPHSSSVHLSEHRSINDIKHMHFS